MIIVIQCAASKRSGAGSMVSADGKAVVFVADPAAAPPSPTHVYARPDDSYRKGISWRELLLKYNTDARDNPLGLLPAYQLYENKTYGRLVDRFGSKQVYILSAGWGLVTADFLTPYYDITFSSSAEDYMRRGKTGYHDFRMLPDTTSDTVLFFGGKSYLPLFCALTNKLRCKRIAFYNSSQAPSVTGCTLVRFKTTTRTNWHYECANAFLAGEVAAP